MSLKEFKNFYKQNQIKTVNSSAIGIYKTILDKLLIAKNLKNTYYKKGRYI